MIGDSPLKWKLEIKESRLSLFHEDFKLMKKSFLAEGMATCKDVWHPGEGLEHEEAAA